MSTILKVNRGDYFSFNMSIEDETQPTGYYELQPNDILYFALLNPHDSFENAIILRGYTYEDAVEVKTDSDTVHHMFTIELLREDTACLAPGIYYYTFKLQKGAKPEDVGTLAQDAKLTTIIERTKFIINE